VGVGFILFMARYGFTGFVDIVARSLATDSALPGTRFPTLGFFSLLARWKVLGFFPFTARWEKMGFSFYMARYGIMGFLYLMAR
jgi:hypothetical protein